MSSKVEGGGSFDGGIMAIQVSALINNLMYNDSSYQSWYSILVRGCRKYCCDSLACGKMG